MSTDFLSRIENYLYPRKMMNPLNLKKKSWSEKTYVFIHWGRFRGNWILTSSFTIVQASVRFFLVKISEALRPRNKVNPNNAYQNRTKI